ncbi:nuclear transport factor 2 family protein [Betaproteobacteria bacterium SCN2]|jgi:predicted ester cyclase|nr:nuclear transport factor 2 family protein [Betaproteobacteria bacterium SCN2]
MKPELTGPELAEHLAREFLSRVWGANPDLDAIDELMTEDYRITSAGTVISGRSEFKSWVSEFQSRMPGARNEVLDVFANAKGDRVASRWICSGTNNGMFGCGADGRHFSFSGLSIWAVRDDMLSECWVERSGLEAYLELSGGK